MSPETLAPRSSDAARVLAVLANEKRLMIMSHLHTGELPVNTLAQLVELSQSALSQHLARLREVNLVQSRRQGQTIFYRAQNADAMTLLQLICDKFVAV